MSRREELKTKLVCSIKKTIDQKDSNWLRVNPESGLLSIVDMIGDDFTDDEYDTISDDSGLLFDFFKFLIDSDFNYLVVENDRYVSVDFNRLKQILNNFINYSK